MAATPPITKRAALYVRISTADRGQTVENQLRPLQEAAGRLGKTIVVVYRDEDISGVRGRDRRKELKDRPIGVADQQGSVPGRDMR
jgi:predicted site-specific integrase-resolvase